VPAGPASQRSNVDGAAEPIGLRERDAELACAVQRRLRGRRANGGTRSRQRGLEIEQAQLAATGQDVLHQDQAHEEQRDGQPLEELADDRAVHAIVAKRDERDAGWIAALGGDDAERIRKAAVELARIVVEAILIEHHRRRFVRRWRRREAREQLVLRIGEGLDQVAVTALRDAIAELERIRHHAASVARHLVAIVIAKAEVIAREVRGRVIGANAIVQRVTERVGEADVHDIFVIEEPARELVERVPVVCLDRGLRGAAQDVDVVFALLLERAAQHVDLVERRVPIDGDLDAARDQQANQEDARALAEALAEPLDEQVPAAERSASHRSDRNHAL
jgi:hypothetical protein